jgi:L-erythro-3,5-diaminohexanoate dehydrogenase
MSDPYGSHRSLEPVGSLPQAADRLDATSPLRDNELLIEVDTLNVDSASFTQIEAAADHDLQRIDDAIRAIVEQRGKLQNPVTGSGGMLMGTISEVGSKLGVNAQGHTPKVGMRIATLVSLSLTPLRLECILDIRPQAHQVKVKGQAILFESGLWTPLPTDLPEEVALAALDVCGAPAQTARLVRPGDRVLVLGAGGKSGILCCYEAARRCGPLGQVIGLECNSAAQRDLEELGFCHSLIDVDATRPLDVLERVRAATGGHELDLVINCVNLPRTEMSTVLPLRQGGTAYFFSMATSFTAAALGAEGLGKDVQMLIGNGFARGHDLLALQILRDCAPLRKLFTRRYAPTLIA